MSTPMIEKADSVWSNESTDEKKEKRVDALTRPMASWSPRLANPDVNSEIGMYIWICMTDSCIHIR